MWNPILLPQLCAQEGEVIANIAQLHEESIVCLKFLGVVCFIRLRHASSRIIGRRSTKANLRNAWPELHLLCRGDVFEHHREAARKPLLILLPRRAVAVGVGLRLEVKLHQIIAGEFPQLKGLEEEMKAKARERMLKPTGPGVFPAKSILKTGGRR